MEEVISKISNTSHHLRDHLHIHHESKDSDSDPAAADNDMEAVGTSPKRDQLGSSGASTRSQTSWNSQGQPQWRTVRALPTWVQAREAYDESDRILPPQPPPPAKGAQRSIYDNQRSSNPFTPSPQVDGGSRWRTFVGESAHRGLTANSEKVSPEYLDDHTRGSLSTPWLSKPARQGDGDGDPDDDDDIFRRHISKKRRSIWYKRAQITLLNNPMIPLTLRGTVWTLSVCALALAGSIFHLSHKYGWENRPSTYMAIIVDAVAMVYLIYITYDEYSSKPLGLRSPKAKMLLIMFDLSFIVFDSANLSLAFDSLYDTRGSCATNDPSGQPSAGGLNAPICQRQRALTAFLFLALTGWTMTFTVSIFRLVERVSRNNAS